MVNVGNLPKKFVSIFTMRLKDGCYLKHYIPVYEGKSLGHIFAFCHTIF